MKNNYWINVLEQFALDERKNKKLITSRFTVAANKDLTVTDFARDAVKMHEDFLAEHYEDTTGKIH